MSEMAQINIDSWKLADSAMIKNRGRDKPYSTSQIRKIMGASKSPDYLKDMNKIIKDYEPAPPQGTKPHMEQKAIREKREKNDSFGKKLIEMGQGRDAKYIQRLLKYTMWNIKIIENSSGKIDKLHLLFDCEGVDKKNRVDYPGPSANSTKRRNDNSKGAQQTHRDFRRN